jgi:hypothetical protein
MTSLKRDHRGYPIPAFVDYVDGKPDFRVMNGAFLQRCIRKKLCWTCGAPIGRFMTFVIGPMCIINRTSSEPPSHLACGEYSVQVCPFLSVPEMRRIDHNLPEDSTQAGIGIARNPGVSCLWTTREYKTFNAGNGILFQIGMPSSVSWWCRGRTATREEVAESIRTGLPLLEAEAAKERGAMPALQQAHQRAMQYLPSET